MVNNSTLNLGAGDNTLQQTRTHTHGPEVYPTINVNLVKWPQTNDYTISVSSAVSEENQEKEVEKKLVRCESYLRLRRFLIEFHQGGIHSSPQGSYFLVFP